MRTKWSHGQENLHTLQFSPFVYSLLPKDIFKNLFDFTTAGE